MFVHIGIGSGYIGVYDVPGPTVGDIDLDSVSIALDAGLPERYAKLFVHFVKTLKEHPVNQV